MLLMKVMLVTDKTRVNYTQKYTFIVQQSNHEHVRSLETYQLSLSCIKRITKRDRVMSINTHKH